MKSEKRKIPLPGYRTIFMVLGALYVLGGVFFLYDTVFRHPASDSQVFGSIMAAAWLFIGVLHIWYSLHLRRENLGTKDWVLGFFVMLAGALTGIGVPLLFMALIWTDSDVKAVFRKKAVT
jgi:uncharacterized membrane protein HdeD (DUF308 family)